jgi:hypothetical protein
MNNVQSSIQAIPEPQLLSENATTFEKLYYYGCYSTSYLVATIWGTNETKRRELFGDLTKNADE